MRERERERERERNTVIIMKNKLAFYYLLFSFVPCLKPCLLPIIALSALKGDVEKMRREAYSTDNDEHKQQLTKARAVTTTV